MGQHVSITVRDYLEREGLTVEELAEQLDLAPSTVRRRVLAVDQTSRRAMMAKKWLFKLGAELPDDAYRQRDPDDGRLPGEENLEPGGGREWERTPQAPKGARVEKPPPAMDLSTFAGYVEGAYKLAGDAIGATDPALAAAVDSHAEAAGKAWARWVESEPKVRALLERAMVGTPLGEVIGVHVAIAFAYFMSRKAMRQVVEQQAADDAADYQHEHFAPPVGAAG